MQSGSEKRIEGISICILLSVNKLVTPISIYTIRDYFSKLNQKENWEDIENQNGNLISLKTLTPKECENRYNNNDNFKSRNKLYTLRKEERFK